MNLKKFVIGVLGASFILGAGTYAFAEENGKAGLNFGQMKPMIEEMHPGLSTKEQKEMFESCHGKDGMMQQSEAESMMNNL